TGRGLGPYVTSSDTIAYEATVTNELSGRYLRGLLESELPVDSVIQTQEIDGLLPLASTTLSGDIALAAAGISASQATSLTLRAGAIVDTVPDHLLWLRFNDAAGATRFADSSVYGTDASYQNVTANGQYVYLQASDGLIVAPVSGMEESTGGFSVGVWFKLTTTNAGTTQWLLHGQRSGSSGSDQGSPYLYVTHDGSLGAFLLEGAPKVLSSAAGAVRANEWHHALRQGLRNPKSFVIQMLGGYSWRRRCQESALPHNSSFSGVYGFSEKSDFQLVFRESLMAIADGGLIMCHPGLRGEDPADPIRNQRWREWQLLASAQFSTELQDANAVLTRFQYASAESWR
ncbi:MAG: hypothetical protein KDE31_31955, partial [Caldilineaceae bacterium]|nr:hypothetical protein [Caldilineaceae bacterium]